VNTIKIKEYPYVFKHIAGCGGDAYFVDHKPKKNQAVLAKTLINIDGSPVPQCSYAKCGTCKKSIYLDSKFVYSRDEELQHYHLTRTLK
jgi:hypothetical protein